MNVGATAANLRLSLPALRADLVERLLERVPGERRALDADGELDDALERLEVAETDAFEIRREIAPVTLAFELALVNRHQCLERADQRARFVDRLAFHCRA